MEPIADRSVVLIAIKYSKIKQNNRNAQDLIKYQQTHNLSWNTVTFNDNITKLPDNCFNSVNSVLFSVDCLTQ